MLKIAVEWGRYGEIYGYDYHTGLLSLPERAAGYGGGAAGRMGETVCRAVEGAEDMALVGRADPQLGVGLGDVLGNLGRLALNRGDVDEAARLFEEVRELFASTNDGRETGVWGALAECLLRRGAIDDGLELIEKALRREQLSGDTEFAAMLHRLRGYAFAGLGKLTDAWADFDESLAVARSRGAAYEVALNPNPRKTPVCIVPSVMRKIPGKRCSQGALAAGMYWRALASMAATPGI